jgi:hypothetical protein
VHSSYASGVLPSLLMVGTGFGFAMAPSFSTGTFGVQPQDAGLASATLNTGQQLGGSIGTSLLNTIFASSVAGYVTIHLSPATLVRGKAAPRLLALASIHGYKVAFWTSVAVLAAGAVLAATLMRSGPLSRRAAVHGQPAAAEAAAPSQELPPAQVGLIGYARLTVPPALGSAVISPADRRGQPLSGLRARSPADIPRPSGG